MIPRMLFSKFLILLDNRSLSQINNAKFNQTQYLGPTAVFSYSNTEMHSPHLSNTLTGFYPIVLDKCSITPWRDKQNALTISCERMSVIIS